MAAVSPVANELDVIWMNAEHLKPVTKLVAVKPATSLLGSFDEHKMFCRG